MESKKHYNAEKVIKDFEEINDYRKVSKKHGISIWLLKRILKGESRDQLEETNTKKNKSKPLRSEEKMKIKQEDIVKDVVAVADDLFKNEYGESAGAMKTIKKFSKYIPLVGNFLKGITESIQKGQQQRQQVENIPIQIQCPAGWSVGSPLNNISKKYSKEGELSEWWKQGLAFENRSAVTPNNVHHVDPNYKEPTRNPTPVQESQDQQPKSLSELSQKYGGDDWDDDIKEVKQNAPVTEKPLENDTDKTTDKNTEEKDFSQVQKTLTADALKYLDLGVNFINELEDDKFIKAIENIDELVEQIQTPLYKQLIPIHLKEVIITTPSSDLKLIVKERCSEKFKIIEEKKLTQKLMDLFDKLKEEWLKKE